MTLVTRDSGGGGGFTTIVDRDLKVMNPFKTEPAVRISPAVLQATLAHSRRNHGPDGSLILSELNPNSVVDHMDGEDVPLNLLTFVNVREVCPKCQHNQLKLVLRQATVRIAHLFCADCESCFDAHYANGAPALTI